MDVPLDAQLTSYQSGGQSLRSTFRFFIIFLRLGRYPFQALPIGFMKSNISRLKVPDCTTVSGFVKNPKGWFLHNRGEQIYALNELAEP